MENNSEVVREEYDKETGVRTIITRPQAPKNPNRPGYVWAGPEVSVMVIPESAFTKYEDDNLI